MVPAGRPVVALLPPGNLKVRFFVGEAVLPQLKLDDWVNISCDGCAEGIPPRSASSRAPPNSPPPVIYSLEERNKLVFLIEARPGNARTFARRPAGQRHACWRRSRSQ